MSRSETFASHSVEDTVTLSRAFARYAGAVWDVGQAEIRQEAEIARTKLSKNFLVRLFQEEVDESVCLLTLGLSARQTSGKSTFAAAFFDEICNDLSFSRHEYRVPVKAAEKLRTILGWADAISVERRMQVTIWDNQFTNSGYFQMYPVTNAGEPGRIEQEHYKKKPGRIFGGIDLVEHPGREYQSRSGESKLDWHVNIAANQNERIFTIDWGQGLPAAPEAEQSFIDSVSHLRAD